MYYYELEASGALAATDKVGGVSLADCHRLSLVKSDNELSEKMVERMGGFRALKLKALEYCGMTESDVDAGYFETTGFTARMMLGILEYLYDGGEVFAGQLELMKTAQEGEYLRSGSCGLEIAQKYGAQVYNGLMNYCAAGIVYADEPFLIVVYTRGVGGAGASVCRKSLAEFRGRSREIKSDHFRRRRVRRRKYISRSGVSNCPPLADNRGAERSAIPFVEEGRAFFDKLKPRALGPGLQSVEKGHQPAAIFLQGETAYAV